MCEGGGNGAKLRKKRLVHNIKKNLFYFMAKLSHYDTQNTDPNLFNPEYDQLDFVEFVFGNFEFGSK